MKATKIKVTAMPDPNGGIEFDVDGVKAKQAKLKLDKDSGPHAIEFMLQDRSGRGLRFDQSDPIWIGEDGPCPPNPGINTDQMSVGSCSDQRLETVDRNDGRPRELRYQLNFIADDGGRAECDPIIQNGGGGGNQ